MRLSPKLCKQHLGRMFEQKWKIQSKQKILDLVIPEELEAKNVEIHDALELVKPKVEKKKPVDLPWPFHPNPYELNGPGHPHWHDDAIFCFNRQIKLIEGVKQAFALTKTIGHNGFPPSLLRLLDVQNDSSMEELVQQALMETMIWDGTQEKLPKRADPSRPHWIFAREYGVPAKRKIYSLAIKLLTLCERFSVKYKNTFSRLHYINGQSKIFLKLSDSPVLFNALCDNILTDNKPLPLLFNENEVKKTRDEEVVNLYPIKSIIGLDHLNIYTEDEIVPISHNNKHLHTLYINHNVDDFWQPEEIMARGIGTCFTFAASQVQHLYGKDVKDVPVPFVVQCVCLDPKTLGFISYQLNTLDLCSSDGIKNQAWIDGPYDLYEECNQSGVTGYNHKVFKKLFAMHLNGIL